MIKPRLILCSGLKSNGLDFSSDGRDIVELDALGADANVNIQLEDVAKVFLKHLSPRLVDLVEIASYVYASDSATSRGEDWSDGASTEAWGRDFHFVIPVRDLEFWQQDNVRDLLIRILNFLSDDTYKFDFVKLIDKRPVQEYLQFSQDEDWAFHNVESVLMFSGGLDSLAGALFEARAGKNLVLVSHRSVGSMNKRQRELFKLLQQTYPNPMIHIPVWINKHRNLGREHTQRTRSFLYSALGSVIAQSIGADGVSFFENGVVSLNLPIADEVVRARASRTTHPRVLSQFGELYALITERSFSVDNPFLFATKTDIVRQIADCGGEHLIQYTRSCAHTIFQSKNQWHCGCCSQCIDRRIAVIAAGQEHNDPEWDYVSDVFTGNREGGYDQNIAINYARHAFELARMNSDQIAHRFNSDLSRAAYPFSNRSEAFNAFVDIHKRHGDEVWRVLIAQIGASANRLLSGDLPEGSMLRLIAGSEHLTPIWQRFADKVVQILTKGIPIVCQTEKPANEPRLQEICDGLLSSYNDDLIREYPFLRWSSSLTKPDWSAEAFGLWIELKYVRKKDDIHGITEAIASDITKYGDNNRHALYVIYDPQHLILDDDKFAEPIKARATMRAAFIR